MLSACYSRIYLFNIGKLNKANYVMPATADVLKTLGIWRSRGCRAGLQYHAKSMFRSIPVRVTAKHSSRTVVSTKQLSNSVQSSSTFCFSTRSQRFTGVTTSAVNATCSYKRKWPTSLNTKTDVINRVLMPIQRQPTRLPRNYLPRFLYGNCRSVTGKLDS